MWYDDFMDITLDAGAGRFCYRVGAIIIHENKILMARNDHVSYYYTIGGRVSFGETSQQAVLRETLEETGVEFEIDRLAFVHENFFIADFADNKPFHEIAFYFLMKPNKNINTVKCESVGYCGGKESLYRLEINRLSEYEFFPEFFKTELINLNDNVKHFVTIQDDFKTERNVQL
jgi:ADP-ribose pyrophosphatase YjhB (NUDIX family)